MNLIKKALFGLTLAGCANFASADVIYDSYFAFPDFSGAGTLQTYQVNVAAGEYAAKAGDMFAIDFIFSTPPSSTGDTVDFTVTPDAPGSVTFSSAGVYAFADFSRTDIATVVLRNLVSGSGIVDTGTYDLFLTGTFLTADAAFTFNAASDIVAVPEPMSLALVGLGLVGLAGSRRRRVATPVIA